GGDAMTISHHPAEDLLLAYASGAADEAVSLLIATHLTFCGDCRKTVRAAEAAGGALLADLAPARMSDESLEEAFSRLDSDLAPPPAVKLPFSDARVPAPLAAYLDGDLDSLRWRPILPGLWDRPLMRRGATRVRLIRGRAGRTIDTHSHRGMELSVVLTGGFTDTTGNDLRGDAQTADAALTHKQTVDPGEDCVILALTDGPLKFARAHVGLFAKLFGF
ncbi:MAG: ChrR family anti-sigma-E factor, partial [Gaiellaceae bacterium]